MKSLVVIITILEMFFELVFRVGKIGNNSYQIYKKGVFED